MAAIRQRPSMDSGQREVEAGDQFIFVVDYEPHRGRIYLEGEPVRVRFEKDCFHVLKRKE
ncbi:MAG: hypothetical protein CVU38_07310 [Chloroflexi bacterium HGW-Chloroflexi-1]|nr:MAG: hypothetical protein CVU38_07310 [Chloroflexi bacterium HGW-Chloroflexi-1]